MGMGHRTAHDPCDPSKIVTHLNYDPLLALVDIQQQNWSK